MKEKFVGGLLVLVMIGSALLLFSCENNRENPIITEEKRSKMLAFTEPLNQSQFSNLQSEFDLTTNEVVFRAGKITVGCELKSNNLQGFQDALNIHRKNMAKILGQEGISNNLRQEIRDSVNMSLEQLLFVRANFIGNPEVISKIISKGIASEFAIQRQKSISTNNAPALQSLNHESWAPYKGASAVERDYLFNLFYFNDVSGFDYINTYEHETQVYSKDYADYGGYWSSDLPSAYKDTQILDKLDNFTVGSSRADDIKTSRDYFCYMTLSPQTNISPDVRIKGQLGYRFPWWCDSTWCIYPKDTTGTMAIFKAPSNGFVQWEY